MRDNIVALIMFALSALFSGYIAFNLTGDIKIAVSAFAVIGFALLGLALAMRHAVNETKWSE